jgi:N-acetylneuraminate synthase
MTHCVVIAEAGVNHNGDLKMALDLVDAAAAAGADVVKFQTFKASRLASAGAEKAAYQKRLTGADENQFEMLKRLELDDRMHRTLFDRCRERGIVFLSTAFDEGSLDELVVLGIDRVKVPSGEITNGPLLLHAARTGLPVILSTGMSTLDDVEQALKVIAWGLVDKTRPPTAQGLDETYHSEPAQRALKSAVTLLHCTTEYPTPFSDVNLLAMDTLRSRFGLPVGLSDHSEGILASIAAVARGASLIEKHFTLDRTLPGPDQAASLEVPELTAMIEGIRIVESALGRPEKVPAASEIKNIAIARKSLVAADHIRRGDLFSPANVTSKRPGTGRSPMDYWSLMGTPAGRDYAPDEVIE